MSFAILYPQVPVRLSEASGFVKNFKKIFFINLATIETRQKSYAVQKRIAGAPALTQYVPLFNKVITAALSTTPTQHQSKGALHWGCRQFRQVNTGFTQH